MPVGWDLAGERTFERNFGEGLGSEQDIGAGKGFRDVPGVRSCEAAESVADCYKWVTVAEKPIHAEVVVGADRIH